jgi:uncharacterized protein with PIN domain
MVIDTSAIAAILFDESEAEMLEHRLVEDPVRLISAATVVEAGMAIAFPTRSRLSATSLCYSRAPILRRLM